jgi:hypothetical protein
MAAPVKNMRTIFPTAVSTDTVSTITTTVSTATSPSRTNVSISGGSLNSMAAGATVTGTLTMAKSFLLLEVVCNYPTRIRLYSSAVAQTADLSRPYTIPINLGTQHGVICELVLSSGSLSWPLSPAAYGSNLDTGSATIYFTVTNMDIVSRSLSVAFTFLPMES